MLCLNIRPAFLYCTIALIPMSLEWSLLFASAILGGCVLLHAYIVGVAVGRVSKCFAIS